MARGSKHDYEMRTLPTNGDGSRLVEPSMHDAGFELN